MQLYGSRKHDKSRCRYGCCGNKAHRHKNLPRDTGAVEKALRHKARQGACAAISESQETEAP